MRPDWWTAETLRNGWVEYDEEGRGAFVWWFPDGPSYAVALDDDLSVGLRAWMARAELALLPFLRTDTTERTYH